jgi:ankyrin repeat protein
MTSKDFNEASGTAEQLGRELLAEVGKDAPDLGRMRAMIDAGTDLECRNDKGMTPLLAAALQGRTEAALLLAGSGATIDATAPEGTTALIFAAMRGDAELTKGLLAAGAEPDAHRHRGLTALMWAANMNKKDVAKALAEAGADPDLKSTPASGVDFGRSAIQFAEDDGKTVLARSLREAAVQVRAEKERLSIAQEKFNAVLKAGMPTQKNVRVMKRIVLKAPRKKN